MSKPLLISKKRGLFRSYVVTTYEKEEGSKHFLIFRVEEKTKSPNKFSFRGSAFRRLFEGTVVLRLADVSLFDDADFSDYPALISAVREHMASLLPPLEPR